MERERLVRPGLWNGRGLSIFGDVYPPYVSALAVSGSNLYAGGWFMTAGGNSANNVAKWNGSSWSALGSGIGSGFYGDSSKVSALAVAGNALYAGGNFTAAGGNPANYIAKWDGTSWTNLSSGVGGYVYALAVAGSNLYVGGQFMTAGGIAATNIAKWGGSSWSPVGSQLSNSPQYGSPSVNALAVSGSNLYAGGTFTNADGKLVNYIARWDGSNWNALGSGMNGNVAAFAISGSELYVGGAFTTAGAKVSAYLAKAIVNPPMLAIQGDGFGGFFLNFSGVPGSAYRLQRAPTLNGPWATSSPQTAPASGWLQFWDVFPPPGQALYRSVGP
ncbi:MAG TPA: hypothetical protein VLT36_05935 [Candidatus Dormibacteraeota bacterium]|nr:hypothetical protein [Candidatus Dormibacteraeota bacterium]